jgi:hypothetical protein
MESAETVSYWRERALDAESELKFIKSEYGDEDSEELTRDALLLKARALESERDSLLKRIDKMMVELDVANAFHNVAVSERNAAWYEVNSLRRELDAVGATTAPLYTSQEREVLIRERDTARAAHAEQLRVLEATQKTLRCVTNGVLNQSVLRSSCEDSSDGVYRVHLRENDWDRLYALCKDFSSENT